MRGIDLRSGRMKPPNASMTNKDRLAPTTEATIVWKYEARKRHKDIDI